MHIMALKEVVESVRRREAQGDCPTEPAQPTEILEEAILEMARQIFPSTEGEGNSHA